MKLRFGLKAFHLPAGAREPLIQFGAFGLLLSSLAFECVVTRLGGVPLLFPGRHVILELVDLVQFVTADRFGPPAGLGERCELLAQIPFPFFFVPAEAGAVLLVELGQVRLRVLDVAVQLPNPVIGPFQFLLERADLGTMCTQVLFCRRRVGPCCGDFERLVGLFAHEAVVFPLEVLSGFGRSGDRGVAAQALGEIGPVGQKLPQRLELGTMEMPRRLLAEVDRYPHFFGVGKPVAGAGPHYGPIDVAFVQNDVGVVGFSAH